MDSASDPSPRQVALLMTRPKAAAARFVAELPASLRAKLQLINAPLMQVQGLEAEVSCADYGGVIFTSANGVAAVTAAGEIPAYCVGQRTTQAAQAAGWQAQCCGANGAELVAQLIKMRPTSPLLHLHGRHTRGDIAPRLSAAGLPCRGQVVYEQQLLPLGDAARQQIGAQSDIIVPLFSPRTARHFASLGLDTANLSLIAISQAVAAELQGLKCKGLQVSKKPDAASMAEMVRDAAVRLTRLEGGDSAQ
ncbi:uroporphyrinogen-III synthase [Pseudophaeobacter profundi]|uniref:uroporphyrinogen-III synthase n=1 Tax=Pseudophaeobacter profundi TaxID=3034152 RepID=UPI00242B745F|nr:uroporphyrinogen-III synthase [Pseudophaeobacter profundi]